MKGEGGDKMTFVDILDIAMYAGTRLIITTKERGQVIGIPYRTDEFETDEERFGYVIDISPHWMDTVFIDEIIEITTSPSVRPEDSIQLTAKLVFKELVVD
jgi:hypothetical protein